MKKSRIVIYSIATIFIISVTFFIFKSTYSSTSSKTYDFDDVVSASLTKSELQALVVNTAMSYYDKRDFIQYDNSKMSQNMYFFALNSTPEDLNEYNFINLNTASFMFSVYMNALHYDLGKNGTTNTNIEIGAGISMSTLYNIAKSSTDKRVELYANTANYSSTGLQAAFINDFNNLLEAGDIILYKKDTSINALLYLGNGVSLRATGKNYDFVNQVNDIETSSALCKNYLSEILFAEDAFAEGMSEYAIIRPINDINTGDTAVTVDVPENSLARKNNILVDRYTDIDSGNSVYPGQQVTFNIRIKNTSSVDTTISSISDIVNNYFIFDEIVAPLTGTENKGTVTWSNISVQANSEVILSYSAHVMNEIEISEADYTKKNNINNKVVIKFSEADTYEMKISPRDYLIANTYIGGEDGQTTAIKEIVDRIVGLYDGIIYSNDVGDDIDYKTNIDKISSNSPITLNEYSFYKFIYYNALGVDLSITDDLTLPSTIYSLFKYDDNTGIYYLNDNFINKNKILSSDTHILSDMLVDGMYGGTGFYDKTGDSSKMLNRPYLKLDKGNIDVTYDKLVVGDIIIYWDYNGSVMRPYTYMYLGRSYVDSSGNPITISEATSNQNNVVGQSMFVRYNGLGVKIITDVDGNDGIINSLYSKILFAIIRPSKITNIPLDDVEVSDMTIKVGNNSRLSYTKTPVNGSLWSISAKSDSEACSYANGYVEGLYTGTCNLELTFTSGNKKITKNISVTVTNEDSVITLNTSYLVDNKNNLIYVGEENSVSNILNNIAYNERNATAVIKDSNDNILENTISGASKLVISYNNAVARTYEIVRLNLLEDLAIDEENKAIKYANVGDTVADLTNQIEKSKSSVTIRVYQDSSKSTQILEGNLKTGYVLSVIISDSVSVDYVIAVTGDVNGDGNFNLTDLVQVRRHMVEYVSPDTGISQVKTGAYLLAIDFNKDGVISLVDITQIRYSLAGVSY